MAKRTVPLKLSYNARRSLVTGPQYTITEDPPWLLNTEPQPEVLRASSTYSHDFDVNEAQDDIMAENIYPHSVSNEDAAEYEQPAPSLPAHEVRLPTMPQQSRTSRLPVFQQVRSMLKSRNTGDKTSPTSAVKWDQYTGELSEHGKEAKVKPSTYKSPYDGILRETKGLSPGRARAESGRDRARSPVSMLIDDDLQILDAEPGAAMSPPNSRPVSPMSEEQQFMPQSRRESEMSRPRTEGNATGQLKRKPVASQIESFPPVGDERIMPNSSHGDAQHAEDPSSRFSWTTAAYSEAPRQSTDTRMSRRQRSVTDHEPQPNSSHFSWSTVASAVPTGMREQTPPPSPPPVPIQFLEAPQYGPPPTQSILSRQRPLKRVDKPEWAPPPQPTTTAYSPRSLTPKVYRIQQEDELSTTPGIDGKKRLPLPPLFTEKSLSHLEALLTQEKNIVMQRRNIERSIVDLERIEKASPLDVSFADVRDAKKKLDERRSVLDEIRKEEMDIGIRISRARRKEDFGDGEGTLWVRRVTG